MTFRRTPNGWRESLTRVMTTLADPNCATPDLPALARLLADETRAAFCIALLDGRAWTAGELARHARVAPSTATAHLNALTAGGLLREHRQGRHRYVQLADDAAALIEALAAYAPRRRSEPTSLAAVRRRDALAHARTCYDHLAGVLGVVITDAMTDRGYLSADGALTLTSSGAQWATGLGIALPESPRRPITRPCLDWTERRPHLAGRLGAALCAHALASDWIRPSVTSRAVVLTEFGRAALAQHLGITAEQLAPRRR